MQDEASNLLQRVGLNLTQKTKNQEQAVRLVRALGRVHLQG